MKYIKILTISLIFFSTMSLLIPVCQAFYRDIEIDDDLVNRDNQQNPCIKAGWWDRWYVSYSSYHELDGDTINVYVTRTLPQYIIMIALPDEYHSIKECVENLSYGNYTVQIYKRDAMMEDGAINYGNYCLVEVRYLNYSMSEPPLSGKHFIEVNMSSSLSSEKDTYEINETINCTLEITNNAIADMLISPIPYFVVIDENGNIVYNDPAPYISYVEPLKIKSKETIILNLTWDQKNDTGSLVPPGQYELKARILGLDNISVCINITDKNVNDTKSNNYIDNEWSIPGFELILMLISSALILFLKRKKQI